MFQIPREEFRFVVSPRPSRAVLLCLPFLLLVLVPGGTSAATVVHASVDAVGTTWASLSWTQTGDWCFSSYELQHRLSGDVFWQTDVNIGNKETLHGTISGLQPSTTYVLRVQDVDCFFTKGGSNELSITTNDPGTPDLGPNVGPVAQAAFEIILVVLLLGVLVAVAIEVRGTRGACAVRR